MPVFTEPPGRGPSPPREPSGETWLQKVEKLRGGKATEGKGKDKKKGKGKRKKGKGKGRR